MRLCCLFLSSVFACGFVSVGDSKTGSRGSSSSRSSSSSRGRSGSGSSTSRSNGGTRKSSGSQSETGTGSVAFSGTRGSQNGAKLTSSKNQQKNNNQNIGSSGGSIQWSSWSYNENEQDIDNINFNYLNLNNQDTQWNKRVRRRNQSGIIEGGQIVQNAWSSWRNSAGGTETLLSQNNKQILELLLSSYLGGPVPKKIAQYNTKSRLIKYRRNYWIGERYYYHDPDSAKQSRITCFYVLTAEDPPIFYEDDTQVKQIVFQCRTYFERCCGMDCCKTDVGLSTAASTPFHVFPVVTIMSMAMIL